MNPSYLNSSPSSFPFIDLNEDQHLEHLISLPHHATPNYFNLNQEYRSGNQPRESLQNQKKVEKNIVLFGGSSDRRAISSSSSSSSLEPTAGDMVCKREDHHEDEGKSTTITADDGSMKWMSSKMRVMRKMTNSDKPAACSRVAHKFNDQINSTNYNSNDFVRVCSDCNTTKTPLWRGGPQGPKSLCNACGIRQRKARRAMAEAANGRTELNYSETSTSTKKSRTSYIAQKKQHFKLIGTNSAHTSHDKKKLSFEDFALSLTSKKNLTFRDEEEAAILLMALSCGLIHS